MKNPRPKTIEESVTSFDYPIQHTIKLSRNIDPLPARFDEVITNRKSTKTFASIDLQQLSNLLWYTAKVKQTFVQDNGYILTHRGAPSAGARHPIDILIYNKENLHYYNPFDHSLNQIATPEITSFIQHIEQIVSIGNGTIFWFVAHYQRTAAKYEHPESLIWRDSGALLNSIQLTCTAMGLNSCPVGSLGEPYISAIFNQPGIFGAGGLLIG